MIRNLANRVVSDGIGAYDAELGTFQAAGQIINQVYQRSTHQCSGGSPGPGGVPGWHSVSPFDGNRSISDTRSFILSSLNASLLAKRARNEASTACKLRCG